MKSLSQIAVEAGLVSRADLSRAQDLADEQRLPLVVVLVRELGVDEVALVGALRRELRVLAIDPRAIRPDTESLREVPRDLCKQLRVVPLQVRGGEPGGDDKELWLAMADPTDHGAIAEVERLTGAVVDVAILPLSAIEDLADRGYQELNTQVVRRSSRVLGGDGAGGATVEQRLDALIRVLVERGVVTREELDEALSSEPKHDRSAPDP
jgi:hypothetical protein